MFTRFTEKWQSAKIVTLFYYFYRKPGEHKVMSSLCESLHILYTFLENLFLKIPNFDKLVIDLLDIHDKYIS